jgi:hypothetical protein
LPIYYKARVGESKLNIWRDGFYNLFFLLKMRLGLLTMPEGSPTSLIAEAALDAPPDDPHV